MNKTTVRPNFINAMKTNSIKTGKEYVVSGTTYRGTPAVYQSIMGKQIKLSKGTPFVRMTLKPHEIKRSQKARIAENIS